MDDCVLTMRTLGSNGRFGNMLYQIMALWGMANALDFPFQIPEKCILREIFDLESIPPIENHHLPQTNSDQLFYHPSGHDMFGYYQFQEALNLYSQNTAKTFLKWKSEFFNIRQECSTEVENKIVCHVRRGDYVSQYIDKYCVIDKKAYERANKYSGMEVIWLGDEEPKRDTYGLPDHLSFLADFWRMVYAPILFRSNSTFSWWAHVFASPKQQIFAPIVGNRIGWRDDVDFVQGNWPVMAHPSNFENCRNTNLFLRKFQ